jgi:hypothetical protein
MVAAEGMRAIYRTLLLRIEKDRFRMFKKQYRLTRLEKGIILAGSVVSNSLRYS